MWLGGSRTGCSSGGSGEEEDSGVHSPFSGYLLQGGGEEGREVKAMGPASMSVFFQELLLWDSGQPHPRRCRGDQQKE